MPEISSLRCDDVERRLCEHVKPGAFAAPPEPLRDHLDKCERCWEFFCDLIILTGRLSRCRESLASRSSGAAREDASEAPAPKDASPDSVLLGSALLRERTPAMAGDLYDRSVPQLPAVIPPAKQDLSKPIAAVPSGSYSRRKAARPAPIAAALVAAVATVAAALFLLRSPSEPREAPRHAILAAQAGEALEAGNYDEAIASAQECIDGFEPAAMRLQEELQRAGRDLPAGRVSPQVRDELLSHGPLNDVAASYFYLGQAYRQLGDEEQARRAYAAAAKFSLARAWDPEQEIFWLPAADAAYWEKKLFQGD